MTCKDCAEKDKLIKKLQKTICDTGFLFDEKDKEIADLKNQLVLAGQECDTWRKQNEELKARIAKALEICDKNFYSWGAKKEGLRPAQEIIKALK